jgi:hypothetical protein
MNIKFWWFENLKGRDFRRPRHGWEGNIEIV